MKPENIELILHGKEEKHLEYKESLNFSSQENKATITRAIAAYTNTRDGGIIVVGMKKTGEQYEREGIHPNHLTTLNEDNLRDFVSAHLTPTPSFTIESEEYKGKTFIFISASPFTRYPSVCAKSYHREGARRSVLTAGVFYVRSNRKPESVPIEALEDLEDLIDFATDQWIQYKTRREILSGRYSRGDAQQQFDAEGFDL